MTAHCPSIGCCPVEVLTPGDRAIVARAAHMSTHRDDNGTHDKSITLLPIAARFVTRAMSLPLARRAGHTAASCRMHTRPVLDPGPLTNPVGGARAQRMGSQLHTVVPHTSTLRLWPN